MKHTTDFIELLGMFFGFMFIVAMLMLPAVIVTLIISLIVKLFL